MMFALKCSSAEKWSLEVSYWPDLNNNPVVAGTAVFACVAQPCGNPADWRNNLIELQWRGGTPAHLNVWRTRYINNVPDPATRLRILSLDLPMPGALIDSVSLGKLGDQLTRRRPANLATIDSLVSTLGLPYPEPHPMLCPQARTGEPWRRWPARSRDSSLISRPPSQAGMTSA
jgi:hypothetical protein